MLISRLAYYGASITTLMTGVKKWWRLLPPFLGLPQRTPFVIELKEPALRFKVRSAMDVWIIKETCLDRQYESFGDPLADGWIVLDIGSGLGDFAVHAGWRKDLTRVYAFEPFPGSFALLEENLRLNGLTNVTAFPLAVAGGAGDLILRTDHAAPVSYSTTGGDPATEPPTVVVQSTTLDLIFRDLHLEWCDFLKIDCEGAEYEILFSAADDTLRSIGQICLEYHDNVTKYAHAELAAFLREKGFLVKLRPNPVHRHIGLLHGTNALQSPIRSLGRASGA